MTTRDTKTYEGVLLEDLFALCSQFHWEHGDFPSSLASSDLGSRCPSDDLMAKAHTDDANAILLKKLLRILNKL